MKKVKFLFCCLIVGLSVAGCFFCNNKDAAKELMILNVEALSLGEGSSFECIYGLGTCVVDNVMNYGMILGK